MSKDPGKDLHGKKAQYYVEYLGWRACRGLAGKEFTEPIVQELLRRRQSSALPKLTIQVSKKELKVSREVTEDGKKKKIKTIKYPSIPVRDIAFATQALEPDTDVVACIYLGFNPKTSSYVHTHVYRCDSPHTARTFVHHLQSITNIPEHSKRLEKIERDLLSRNAIDLPYSYEVLANHNYRIPPQQVSRMPMESSATSTGSNERSPTGSDDLDADLVSLKDVMPFDAIADELKHRMNIKSAPILLPPADYDTVSRARGNLDEAYKRKSRNPIIVGAGGSENQTTSLNIEGAVNTQGSSTGSDEIRTPDSDRPDDHQFPSEGFYLYPPRSPREYKSEPASPRINVYNDVPSSPRGNRYNDVTSSPRGKVYSDVPSSPRINVYNDVPSSPRHNVYNDPPSSPRANVYNDVTSSPRISRHAHPPVHGRQHSSSSNHSHHSNGSGSGHPSSGLYDSRERLQSDRLSGYSNNSNRDLSGMDDPRSDYQRGNFYREDVLLRPKDMYSRAPHLTNSMPADILRREMANAVDRDFQRLSAHAGYADQYGSLQPPSPRPGDFGVRRVNSMYR